MHPHPAPLLRSWLPEYLRWLLLLLRVSVAHQQLSLQLPVALNALVVGKAASVVAVSLAPQPSARMAVPAPPRAFASRVALAPAVEHHLLSAAMLYVSFGLLQSELAAVLPHLLQTEPVSTAVKRLALAAIFQQ